MSDSQRSATTQTDVNGIFAPGAWVSPPPSSLKSSTRENSAARLPCARCQRNVESWGRFSPASMITSRVICSKCGVTNHPPTRCPNKGDPCGRCGRYGHLNWECVADTHACGVPVCCLCDLPGHFSPQDAGCPLAGSANFRAAATTSKPIGRPIPLKRPSTPITSVAAAASAVAAMFSKRISSAAETDGDDDDSIGEDVEDVDNLADSDSAGSASSTDSDDDGAVEPGDYSDTGTSISIGPYGGGLPRPVMRVPLTPRSLTAIPIARRQPRKFVCIDIVESDAGSPA